MKLKIKQLYERLLNKYKWQFIFIMFFPFMFACNTNFGSFNLVWLDELCKYWSILNCFVIIYLYFFVEEKKISNYLIVIFIICIFEIIVTINNHLTNQYEYYLIFKNIYYECKIIGICLLIDMYKSDSKSLFKALLIHFQALVYLNFITIIQRTIIRIINNDYSFFYDGEKYSSLWFGNHNQTIVILIPAILLSFICIEKNMFKKQGSMLLIVSLLTMVFGWSATARIALILGSCFYIIYIKNNKNKIVPSIYIVILTITFISILLVFIYRPGKYEILENIIKLFLKKSPTFSSRTIAWDEGIKAISKKPIFGYGCNPTYVENGIVVADHLHNEILQRLFETGIIGLALFVISQIILIKKVNKLTQSKSKIACICCLYMFNITSMVSNYTRFFYFYILFMISYHLEEIINFKGENVSENK